MKTTIYASIIIIIVGGLLMTAPAFAGSSFTVGVGEKYTTISAALLDMKDGDSCIIKTGIYRECITVPQNNVTLRGALAIKDIVKTHVNNHAVVDKAALANPAGMDFTPTSEALTLGGVPVMGTAIPYVGAVDPAKGMWRYGADESKLPLHVAAEQTPAGDLLKAAPGE